MFVFRLVGFVTPALQLNANKPTHSGLPTGQRKWKHHDEKGTAKSKFLSPYLTSPSGLPRHSWPSSPFLLTPLETPRCLRCTWTKQKDNIKQIQSHKYQEGPAPWLQAALHCHPWEMRSPEWQSAWGSWKSTQFPHNLSRGHSKATSLKVVVGS